MTIKTANEAWQYHVQFHHGMLRHSAEVWFDEWWEECEMVLKTINPELAAAPANAPAPSFVDFLLGRRPRP